MQLNDIMVVIPIWGLRRTRRAVAGEVTALQVEHGLVLVKAKCPLPLPLDSIQHFLIYSE